ncbi:peroxidase family protein [Methylotetracoccus oryzae]|uniref:peroxidase family protein n=1 Tax=Methylotetracoccus oryzae TaxID=1919059 RepID=UPI0011189056|nr:peroxidase family protein [Methylotetracoccus oryzae]
MNFVPNHVSRMKRTAMAVYRVLSSSALMGTGLLSLPAPQVQAAPALGFTLNASDLRFILTQIQIAEGHVAVSGYPCSALRDQIPSPLLPYGLRTVDGRCNNLIEGQEEFGAADRVFPRLAPPSFRPAEEDTSYSQKFGLVKDSVPRLVSNLIVDQTDTNPAAVAAAGEGAVEDLFGTLFIPNRAPDEGLSAPYNSTFTLFGQFFDHGLDLVTKGGGTVFMPLRPDDPLYIPGSPTNFMVLTRATNLPGPDNTLGTADDIQEATNTTTPFVDQNQTYTSHPSHQVFLRAYLLDESNRPIPSGKLLDGQIAGNIANWSDVKAQAAELLGIQLTDADISNVPLLATDPYGHFVPGPNGFPQVVFPGNALREGDPAAPISVLGAVRTGHAFLDDIAHNAVPRSGLTPDSDEEVNPPGPLADAGTYDDELLNAHFLTGDGRGNENIGLTAIHTVFHAEHNRLAVYLNDLINALPAAQKDQWKASNAASGWEYGERLFQAARFVTEMQYQHLVFEEFARKVQPQVNVFASYHTEIDPAISAEFAHTVYRFGHSMLTEVVARNAASGAAFDIPLLDAFLNPLAFNQGPSGTLDARLAAGSIFRGMTDQVGNELDEFVTEALRNRLLGLPLDLATINLARGRSEGIPRLQAARAAFFNETGNAALAPYQNWADFGLGLRHPESLVNFIAAYGTHPTIAGTQAQRRAAAAVLLDPASSLTPPEDSLAFITGTGDYWGEHPTGLGDVDFWIGGLAEAQSPFGGLLGSTFNYVFETQLEKLQDGDRFYYLSRTAGLNLLVQLEGNSFAEIVMRNTDANALPADAFSRADFRFNVEVLGSSGAIVDDPNTSINESTLLTRMSDGTIRFAGAEHVVWNGTTATDWLRSGLGDDTLRGNEGDDRLEGGAGNDQLIGGDGDDILTDSFGDDVLKGGDGNDALFSGPGFDLNQGGLGNDYIVGGSDPTETFGGPGNDVIFAGDSSDTVFGDDGDDWIEGGGQSDLLQGDNGAPFQDDPNEPGNDVIIGNGGDDDYDAEGGDDIMVTGPGIERNEGMLGFDWVTHKNDPAAANADMEISALLPPNVDALRDRYDLVEAVSGWRFNDNLRGDSRDAAAMVGNELTEEGIARIAGLAELLPAGATSFTGGNIMLGGAGSDRIEGRGGNDLIDGDAWLNVQLAAAYAPDDVRVFDSMNPLRTDVQTGVLNPGFIEIRREIVPGTPGTDIDTAVFSGPQEDYDMSVSAGVVTVIHARGTGLDGTDTLRHIERLAFCNAIDANGDCPPGQEAFLEVGSVGSNTPASGTINISDTSPAENQALTATPAFTDGQGVNTASIVLTWEAFNGSTWTAVGTGTSFTPGDALVGQAIRVVANFTDNAGHAETITSAPTDAVANVNSLPVGIPTLDAAGTEPQTQTPVTANIDAITDEDGLTGASFAFRWQQSSGGLFTDIPGATGLTFIPGPAEVGKRVRIAVSFIDDRGTLETVFSALSGIVGNVMTGTAAADFLSGTGGRDKISPLAGNDTVNANGGDDLILIGLNSGYDAVNGGPGTDRIEALASNTFIGLSSLTGVEQISGNGFSNVIIRGTGDANILNFSNVTLTSIARINGGAGDDTLTGSAQADVIDGGAGADNLTGGVGDDILVGGAGPDTMNGGDGLDTFRFASGFGSDVINGFDANPAGGQDLLDIRQLGVSAGTFASRVVITGVGADTVVTISSGGTIRLVARPAANIGASDFIVNP